LTPKESISEIQSLELPSECNILILVFLLEFDFDSVISIKSFTQSTNYNHTYV